VHKRLNELHPDQSKISKVNLEVELKIEVDIIGKETNTEIN
jgi:hypothetical protein